MINEHSNPSENCILGNHHRDSFPTASYRAKENLELVHTNLYGPMETQSIRVSFYFLIFIDYFSKNFRVYLLMNKYENFSKFIEFKALVEKITGKYIKVLRGGEYDSHEIIGFCKQQDIKR
jgi:hypothetical protein